MERAKQQQQQQPQQPASQSAGGQGSAAPAPASKPLPVNGPGGAATSKDASTTNKDIKPPHRSVHDNGMYSRAEVDCNRVDL